jgi:hypothetical protein
VDNKCFFNVAMELDLDQTRLMNYYASPAVSSGGLGTFASPWPLRTALSNGSQTAGDTLWLRGGTYFGKFTSTLAGGTVRSYTGEWAVIDGYLTTTLTGDINAAATSIDVTSTVGIFGANELVIDDEDVQVSSVTDADTLSVNRGWNGTTPAAHTAGATIYVKAGGAFTVLGGDNTTYRDFEVTNSGGLRDAQVNSGASAAGSGARIISTSDGNSFINLIVHNNGDNGIFVGSGTSNTTIYGCLVFNNGSINSSGNNMGMGIYAESASGYSRIYRNIFINTFNGNAQFGGDGAAYAGGDHQHNVFANSGAPVGENTVNYLGRAEGLPLSVTDNYFFNQHSRTGGSVSLLGYGEAISLLTVNDNYFVGGLHGFDLQNVDEISGSGNHFFNNNDAYLLASEIHYYPTIYGYPTGTFNNNTYHKSQGGTLFLKELTGPVGFAQWKTDSGFDAASSETAVNLPDTVVVVPNEYEAGRAHVIIYATSNPTTVNVDLSTTGLTNGQAYTIKNAFDYFGSNVTAGTYNSGAPTITITLADADSVATPTGRVFTPATTVPDFAALVVVPGTLATSSVNQVRRRKSPKGTFYKP